MATDRRLEAFIAHARGKGMDHATIRILLLSAGWKERDIATAISAEGLSMPVPVPPDTGGARDVFWFLLSFAGLYATVIAVVVLLFTYIDAALPDPAFERGPIGDVSAYASSVRWSIASIVVAFPVFLIVTRMLLKEIERRPEKGSGAVRRWLTYFTLFLAALALAGDAMSLLYSLLEGELTLRFLFKVLAVFAVSAAVFGYEFLSLRLFSETPGGAKWHRVCAMFAMAAMIGAIAWGFVLVDSPGTERLRKFDERRIEDLQVIQAEVQNIVHEGRLVEPYSSTLRRPLPRSLEEIASSAQFQRVQLRDPQSGEMYTYVVLDRTRYQLCATFTFARASAYNVQWDHPAGAHCFVFDAVSGQKR